MPGLQLARACRAEAVRLLEAVPGQELEVLETVSDAGLRAGRGARAGRGGLLSRQSVPGERPGPGAVVLVTVPGPGGGLPSAGPGVRVLVTVPGPAGAVRDRAGSSRWSCWRPCRAGVRVLETVPRARPFGLVAALRAGRGGCSRRSAGGWRGSGPGRERRVLATVPGRGSGTAQGVLGRGGCSGLLGRCSGNGSDARGSAGCRWLRSCWRWGSGLGGGVRGGVQELPERGRESH